MRWPKEEQPCTACGSMEHEMRPDVYKRRASRHYPSRLPWLAALIWNLYVTHGVDTYSQCIVCQTEVRFVGPASNHYYENHTWREFETAVVLKIMGN